MELYLVRHGETEYNKQKRCMGQTESPLYDTGIHQVLDVKKKLAANY